ncbi:MAG: ECF-type sigma factor [Acidobacteriota bacterium]
MVQSKETVDGTAEEVFVERYGALLERVVSGIVARRRGTWRAASEGCEDVIQEVYCRLFERGVVPLLELGEGQVVVYLQRVARHVLLDRQRSRRTRKRGGGWVRTGWASAQHSLVAADSPEQTVLGAERRRQFVAACRRLARRGPAGWRDAEICARVLLEGWTSREVSRALRGALAPTSIDSLLWRMRRRLQEAELPEGWRQALETAFGLRSSRIAAQRYSEI